MIQSEITIQVIKGQVRSGEQEGDLGNLVSTLHTVSGYAPVQQQHRSLKVRSGQANEVVS